MEQSIGGTLFSPVFQQYFDAQATPLPRGELLSRVDSEVGTEEFFVSLTPDTHFDVATWQVDLARSLRHEHNITAAININNSILDDDARREQFLELAAQAPVPVIFEFTETHPMPPTTIANRLLRSLREMGHLSALDDFGAGINGVSLLTDYDFDIIKIDRSMTYEIEDRPEKQRTLRTLQEILSILGRDHVVEGIETPQALHVLADSGFNTFQGFLHAPPRPLSEWIADTAHAPIKRDGGRP